MTHDPICPAVDDVTGRRCERWDLPTAHSDDLHQAGRRQWRADRHEQLALDLGAVS